MSPRRMGRGLRAIDAHAAHSLLPRDATRRRGVPCTTVARTLLDLAEVIDRPALERAFEQAEVLRLLDAPAVENVLERAHGRRGAPILRAILADVEADSTPTRSRLEDRFLSLCAHAGLARPAVNARIDVEAGSLEVDFLWAVQRLVVEADSFQFHGTRTGFERDRARDRRLTLAGYRVVRFTWRHLTKKPDEIVATLRVLLDPAQPAIGER